MAIEGAPNTGNGILKNISPNDVGLTQNHQAGYYLPKPIWEKFTNMPPEKGKNDDRDVRVIWQNGLPTDSKIKWYGAAKSEYRLTTFGKDFPYRTHDNVGDLLVIVVHAPKL